MNKFLFISVKNVVGYYFFFISLTTLEFSGVEALMASKESSPKSIVVEYKISMYCKACEKAVAQIIHKSKGVEMFSTDMIRHRVMVKGQIQPEKILKKLKKKTGKNVEIILPNDAPKPNEDDTNDNKDPIPILFDDFDDNSVFTMFSDENPNACSIM